jgi:predicted MFS family arabinose efflux permease
VILAVFIEAAFGWGAFAYVGADLHLRFGLSFTLVGLFVAAFGVGGLLYTSSVRFWVRRLGQTGLSTVGGLLVGVAFLALAAGTTWWLAPFAIATIGLGFYMLHNTLQTNATQMTPQARGTAVAIFSSALYLGQTAGVAAGSLVIDRHGAMPVFLAAAAVLPVLGWIFARALRRRPRPPLSQ